MKMSEMTKPEVDKVLSLANLTKDELEVFLLLSKGYTRVQIEEETRLSIATIGRIKLRIENKIAKLQKGGG